MAFFTLLAFLLGIIGMCFFIPVFIDFLHRGVVKIPTLVFSVLIFLCAVQSFFSGMILDNIIKNSKQTFELKLIERERELKDRKKEIED